MKQAKTLSDHQQQQVLENLALICSNPGALPHFATANGGGTRVSDSANVGSRLDWNVTTLTGITGNAGASTNLQENWTLNPINDPVKLDLIRCVLLYATGRISCDGTDPCCASAAGKLTKFFDEDWAICDLPPPGFFKVLDEEPCADDCCMKWAEECGTVVAVDRRNYAHLTKLTLAILDIATISSEDLSKRMNPAPAKVEVKESYLANIGGKLRWIEGEYSLKKGEYEDLRAAGIEKDKAVDLFEKTLQLRAGALGKDFLKGVNDEETLIKLRNLGTPLRMESPGLRRDDGNLIPSLIQQSIGN